MPTLLQQISAQMAKLRKSEQRIAKYILLQPERIKHMRLADLASATQSSEPSVIRFCKHMNYSGYTALQKDLISSESVLQKFNRKEVLELDDVAELVSKVISTSVYGLINMNKSVSHDLLEEVITILDSTKRIDIYAFGGSVPIAMDAQHKLFRLEIKATVHSDPHIQRMAACSLDNESVVLAISHSGRTEALMRSLEIVSEQGTKIIAFTPHNSPLASIATHAICVDQDNPDMLMMPMSTRLVYLTLIDIITIGIAQKRGSPAQSRLRTIVNSQSQLRVSNADWTKRQSTLGNKIPQKNKKK